MRVMITCIHVPKMAGIIQALQDSRKLRVDNMINESDDNMYTCTADGRDDPGASRLAQAAGRQYD